jgi:hypothetical protein
MSQILKMTRFKTLDLIVAADGERVEANGTEQMLTSCVSFIKVVNEKRMS